jgi:hypothetical protein
MAKAFGEAQSSAEAATLTHPEWLALLLDRCQSAPNLDPLSASNNDPFSGLSR